MQNEVSRIILAITSTIAGSGLGYFLAPKGYKWIGASIGAFLGFHIGRTIGNSYFGTNESQKSESKPLTIREHATSPPIEMKEFKPYKPEYPQTQQDLVIRPTLSKHLREEYDSLRAQGYSEDDALKQIYIIQSQR